MNLQSALILIAIFVLLGAAIVFICQNGGWQGGCGGNCARCQQKCSTPEKKAEALKKDSQQPKDGDPEQ